jgi:hypothetical protein
MLPPRADIVLEPGARLILIGDTKSVDELRGQFDPWESGANSMNQGPGAPSRRHYSSLGWRDVGGSELTQIPVAGLRLA